MDIYFNNSFRNKVWALLILCSAFLSIGMGKLRAQTLVAGDIAFIGYDFGAVDGFSFIALKTLPAGETLYFTEQGWTATGWASNTETHLKWVIPANVPCGTIISIIETSPDVFTVTGTSGVSFALSSGFNLSGGDQILAYQSTSGVKPTNPIFIAGVHGDYNSTNYDPVTTWNDNNFSGTAESILPPGLTNGVNCVSLFPYPGPEIANSKYTGTLNGTAAALRASINNPANWAHDGSASLGITPSQYTAPNVNCTVVVDATVSTATATGIGAVKATLGGTVTADGGATVTERGIVWALTSNPTTSEHKEIIGAGTGTFSKVITALPPNTTINFRAYAINSNGTAYGSNLTLTTNKALTATISSTNITCNGATNGTASVTASDGVAPYTYSWAPTGGTAAVASNLPLGTYTCTITDNEGTVVNRSITITQPLALQLTYTGAILINKGAAFSHTFLATGGTPGYSYSSTGTPPTGLTLSTAGVLSGTPTVPGNYSFTVSVTDANNCIKNINVNINVESPLPVDLVNFNTKVLTNGVEATWTTTAETNSSHFELWHATENGTFKLLTKVDALGESNIGKRYAFLHKDAVNGANYYQLLQIDKNGLAKDYGTKQVNLSTLKEEVLLFPNPASQLITIKFPANVYYRLKMISTLGKVMASNKIDVKAQEYKLNIAHLPAGIYTIVLLSNNSETIHKFIKQ